MDSNVRLASEDLKHIRKEVKTLGLLRTRLFRRGGGHLCLLVLLLYFYKLRIILLCGARGKPSKPNQISKNSSRDDHPPPKSRIPTKGQSFDLFPYCLLFFAYSSHCVICFTIKPPLYLLFMHSHRRRTPFRNVSKK